MAWRKNAANPKTNPYLEPLAVAYEMARAACLKASPDERAAAQSWARTAERRLSRALEPGDGGAYFAGTGYRYSLDAAGEMVRAAIKKRPARDVDSDRRRTR